MKTLFIDGGGTKTATYLKENKEITKEKFFGPCNINTNFENSKNTILEILDFYKNEFNCVVAGFAGAETNKAKLIEIKELMKKFTNKIELYSDLELFTKLVSKKIESDNFFVLNLGTGTAIVDFKNNDFNLYLGWGKLIGDICSGYDIGMSFIKFCAEAEDKDKENIYYQKFLKDFNLNSLREYIPLISETNNVSKISLWISSNGIDWEEKFMLPRIKKITDYLNYFKFDTIVFTGSMLLKNNFINNFMKNYYSDKKIYFLEFKNCI